MAGSCAAIANGGGYVMSGTDASGDIAGFEPKAVENVRILDEKLTALVGPGSTDVEVRYVMRNVSDGKVKVKFGFPVEESVLQSVGGVAIPPPKAAGPDAPKSIRDYRVEAAGREVAAKWRREVSKPKDDPRYSGLSGWMVSEMTFAAAEEKVVTLRYTVGHDAGAFVYRLSTGGCWAGTIGSGRIVIRPSGIDPRNLQPLRPVNRFKRAGDDWVWDFENLEPTLDDDMRIAANAADEAITDDANPNFHRYGKQWTVEQRRFKVTASSVLPPEGVRRYAPSNLDDGHRVWAEGKPGPGVGEWLEIRPEIVKPRRSITLDPGYQAAGEELFKANARPKRVKVILNGDHSFSAEIPDRQGRCVIAVRDYDKPVEKVRLVFEEVWPGTRFEDLCVSGIMLELRLDKKPKINPYR